MYQRKAKAINALFRHHPRTRSLAAQPRQGRNIVAQGATSPGCDAPHPLQFPLPRSAGEGESCRGSGGNLLPTALAVGYALPPASRALTSPSYFWDATLGDLLAPPRSPPGVQHEPCAQRAMVAEARTAQFVKIFALFNSEELARHEDMVEPPGLAVVNM